MSYTDIYMFKWNLLPNPKVPVTPLLRLSCLRMRLSCNPPVFHFFTLLQWLFLLSKKKAYFHHTSQILLKCIDYRNLQNINKGVIKERIDTRKHSKSKENWRGKKNLYFILGRLWNFLSVSLLQVNLNISQLEFRNGNGIFS